MEVPSFIALSRLVAQSRALEVTATNMANANTPGFKAERVLFSDWLSKQTGADAPRGGKVVSFVQDRATYRDAAAGPVQHTGNPLDLALGGDGYFTVDTPRGPRLTRAGRFALQANGTVGDGDGNPLLDTAGQPLRVAAADTQLHVAGDGTLSSENGRLGKIGIVTPADPNKMHAQGDHLLTSSSPTAPVAQPRLVGGAVEDSNVQPVAETTRMMNQLREFQFVTQFVEAESQREQGAIDKLTQHQT